MKRIAAAVFLGGAMIMSGCDQTSVPGSDEGSVASAVSTSTSPVSCPASSNPAPTTNVVTSSGGTVDHLFFAVVGDTRPPKVDQTPQYPTSVISQIYCDMQTMNPPPQFVVGTGDYMFATPTGGQAPGQVAMYQQAQSLYKVGPVFAAMGNHECDGYTADNCSGAPTSNFNAYMSALVQPLGQTLPYYSIPFNASNGSWSAKLILLACNDWDSTQLSWLQQQLATPTTYTFVARHEPAATTNAPCVNDVENLLAQYPYNISITGHSHTFAQSGKQIIVGTGGAPLASSASTWGYTTVEQTTNGFTVTAYDYASGAPLSTQTIPF
jgi:hypothetical protein